MLPPERSNATHCEDARPPRRTNGEWRRFARGQRFDARYHSSAVIYARCALFLGDEAARTRSAESALTNTSGSMRRSSLRHLSIREIRGNCLPSFVGVDNRVQMKSTPCTAQRASESAGSLKGPDGHGYRQQRIRAADWRLRHSAIRSFSSCETAHREMPDSQPGLQGQCPRMTPSFHGPRCVRFFRHLLHLSLPVIHPADWLLTACDPSPKQPAERTWNGPPSDGNPPPMPPP